MISGSRAAEWIWAVRRACCRAREQAWKPLGLHGGRRRQLPVALAETRRQSGDPNAKYLKEITETCTKDADWCSQTLEAGKIPIVLGGDHSIAAGTVSGRRRILSPRRSRSIGLIWIDAHTDINTPDTSPSGNVHGMPLGAIMGWVPPTDRTSMASRRR